MLSFYDFLNHTSMNPADPNAIPEYEIMRRINSLLPVNTPSKVLRRLWRDAFLNADPVDRRLSHRVRKGVFK